MMPNWSDWGLRKLVRNSPVQSRPVRMPAIPDTNGSTRFSQVLSSHSTSVRVELQHASDDTDQKSDATIIM
jgi:hypothetical protein